MKDYFKRIVLSNKFDNTISAIIILNCTLIGVETYFTNPLLSQIQLICLIIFTIEISLRFIARESTVSFFKDRWNNFDLAIVIFALIPESIISDASIITTLRILRIFRILRLSRINSDLKLIINVMLKSLSTLLYNFFIFIIFLYLFAIIGITLFKLPNPKELTEKSDDYIAYYKLQEIAPNAPINSPDPYGSLHESVFTLFRISTAEDWTDLRYNLMTASELGVIKASKGVINTYHILWFVISVFLLLNLLLGAILTNYDIVMKEKKINNKKE